MYSQQEADDTRADGSRADPVSLHQQDEHRVPIPKPDAYQLAFAQLPIATQKHLQFVRWLVELGRLDP